MRHRTGIHGGRRCRGTRGAAAAVGLIGLVALGSTVVLAQTASQIVPPTFRPDLPRLEGSLVFSGDPGLEPPPGADQLSVTLSGVTIEGGFPELAAAASVLERRLVGPPIPVSAIFLAAQDLEAEYARAGYVLARVVIPAQNLRDGDRLRLVVVDGFVEDIRVEGVSDRVRTRVAAVIEPLRGARQLTLPEIERRLLIAGDLGGLALNSALAEGETPGGTLLIVEGAHRPVTGFVGIDNTLSDALGEWSLSAGLELNSLFRLGETIYFRASGHPTGDDSEGLGGLFTSRPQVRVLAAGAVLPVGPDGWTLNVEGTQSRETPDPFDGFRTGSDFARASVRALYPWRRSRDVNVNLEFVFDAQSENLFLIIDGAEEDLSRDRTRVLRAAADASWVLESGALAATRAVVSFGLDAFGARDPGPDAEVPLSRQGASPDFQKLEIAGSYVLPVTERLTAAISGRAQTSFGQPLVSSERFGIASAAELSTFDAGSLGGDSGWVVRAELQAPNTVALAGLPLQVTPYAYAGTGALYLEEPTALERSTLRVSSLAVGVNVTRVFDARFSSASLTAEYGRGFRNDDFDDDNRFTLIGSYRF
jgi:hemolysin activation/secretion protein